MSKKSEEEMKEINRKKAAAKGKFWINDGKIEKYSDVCPEGFIKGRLKKTKEQLEHYNMIRKNNKVGEKISKSLKSRSAKEKQESLDKRLETLSKKTDEEKKLEYLKRMEKISKRTEEENKEIRRKQLETMKRNGYIFKSKQGEKSIGTGK